MKKEAEHPLHGYPESEIIEYLSVVAYIAAADGEVTDSEISKIRELCKTVGLPGAGIGKVIGIAEDPSSIDIKESISKLSESKLKFTLVTDMLFMAFADKVFASSEEETIKELTSQLNITEEQLEAMQEYVKAVTKAQEGGSTKEDLKDLGGEVAAGLASAGVPIAAVAVSGYAGLSAAGISSGLATLGLGLGMTTGIGVVAALGIGSYLGVKYLYKKLTDDNKK
jgi:uncharacterized tellurite resistance protein B-like protein